jgi:hypothetical protein
MKPEDFTKHHEKSTIEQFNKHFQSTSDAEDAWRETVMSIMENNIDPMQIGESMLVLEEAYKEATKR